MRSGNQEQPQAANREAPEEELRAANITPPAAAKGFWRLPRLSWRSVLAGAALCGLIVATFFPATQGGFVWDDAAFTTVEPVQSLSGIWKIWFQSGTLIHEGHYWPILYTTFWLEHKLWGFDPLYFHSFNLVLHAVATLLLWQLLVRMEVLGAWLAAAVFAVHPLHVESVAWVIGRKDMLATIFYLLAVLNYMRFVQYGQRRNYIWTMGMFVASLLSKYIAVTMPATLLLWHWWKKGRVTIADVLRVSPLLLVGLFITIADWAIYSSKEIIYFGYTFIERCLLAAQSLCFYVSQLVWPTKLAVVYPRWEISTENLLGWVFLATVVIVPTLLWVARRRIGRGFLAGLLFFAITVSPTLGFLDYGYMQFSFVADRYQYLAGAGVTTALVAAVVWVWRAGLGRLAGLWVRAAQLVALLVPAALLGVLGSISWKQAGIYENQGVFFSYIISQNPMARGAHHSLGFWHQQNGRYQEALDNFHIAIKKRPNNDKILNKMGMVNEMLGDISSAEEYYRRALQKNPRAKHSLGNLGLLRTRQGYHQEAYDLFMEVLKIDPSFVSAYNGLGLALFGMNRLEEAQQYFDQALSIDPNLVDARINRDRIAQILQTQSQSTNPEEQK